MTGIANRRTFDARLEQEWTRASRDGEPLSLALVDVDHFKRFNDTYGHARGDECLRAVARALAGTARRPADLVARYGGEEFGLVLPGTAGAGAASLLAGILEAVRELGLEHAASDCATHVTISGGRNVREERWFSVASWETSRLSFVAQTARRDFQPTPGTTGRPPTFDEQSTVLHGKGSWDVRPKTRLEATAMWLKSDIADVVSDFRGDLGRVALTLLVDSWPGHSWIAGVDSSVSDVSYAAHAPPPRPGQPPSGLVSLPAEDRTMRGVMVQDRIDLGPAISMTLGARFDSYSDLDSRVTPRASLVWRAGDRHILKAQYAEGFRPPTFFELYQPPSPANPNPRYPFEVNATMELNYVYRSSGRVGRATAFRSVLKDMIRPGGVVIADEARLFPTRTAWVQLGWTR